MSADLLGKIRRGLKKPPGYIASRLLQEAHCQVQRYVAPRRAALMSAQKLARGAGHDDVAAWWAALVRQPYFAQTAMDACDVRDLCAAEEAAIFAGAERVLLREVDLLGSGPVRLGEPIDWMKDYKTGFRWPNAYCRDIEYANLDQPSDVKFPWEISRMQWLIPAGQAYLLTGDDRYAVAVRSVIEEWIDANPYAMSVNWSCTMDVAIRGMTWTWLFHALNASPAWADSTFRAKFLEALWLAGAFTENFLEKSDVNGNHYTADAAGLVFIGLFFGAHGESERWADLGWRILTDELPRQIFADGVDFEASVPYHRLVQELFLYPALYRMQRGLPVDGAYRQRLSAMARFTEAYSRPNGSVPLWGDADDARALPFSQQRINDHRYLLAIAGIGLEESELIDAFSGSRAEPLWIFGADAASHLPDRAVRPSGQRSAAFRDGGFFVLRNDRDHVFVDCGPLGLAGRGGHGHNDLLSFEAVLDGVHLVSDCGSYLYTASMEERNNFRSTSYHNTPQIDGEEINRFIRPDYLWFLSNDAQHEVEAFKTGPDHDRLIISHDGYRRLAHPVQVRRTIALDHRDHRLSIRDDLIGHGAHEMRIPFHFSTGVTATKIDDAIILESEGRRFMLAQIGRPIWDVEISDARISPSYGVVCPTKCAIFRRNGPLMSLDLVLQPI